MGSKRSLNNVYSSFYSDLENISSYLLLSRTHHNSSTCTFPNHVIRTHRLSQDLNISLLELASLDESLGLASPDSLDLISDLETVELTSKSSNLIGVNLALDGLNIAENGVDVSGRGLAGSEVVGVLDGALEDTLVLLDSVLGSLLCLLGGLTVSLGSSLGLLASLLLGELSGLSILLSLLLSSLTLETLLVLGGVGLLSESLDTLITGGSVVQQLAETCVVVSLLLLASVGVLALLVSLLVTVLVVIGNILVEVLESSPAVEVVPEVVEFLDLLLGGVGAAE